MALDRSLDPARHARWFLELSAVQERGTREPGASSDCSIVFTRSSANQPRLKTTLTITTGWDTTWSANDVPQGALDDQVMTSRVGVPVAEVQTIITKN